MYIYILIVCIKRFISYNTSLYINLVLCPYKQVLTFIERFVMNIKFNGVHQRGTCTDLFFLLRRIIINNAINTKTVLYTNGGPGIEDYKNNQWTGHTLIYVIFVGYFRQITLKATWILNSSNHLHRGYGIISCKGFR